MMFGLAATFGLVSLVDTPAGKMRWALIPAGIMAAVGLIIVSASLHMVGWLWPLLIIATGLVFIFKSIGERNQNAD